MIKLGTSKVKITPDYPVMLCGFGFRTTPFEKVRKDIYAKVFAFKSEETEVVLIYGDLLWWNTTIVDELKPIIEKNFSLPLKNVIFTASHNHSGPGTGYAHLPSVEATDSNYYEYLKSQVLNAIELALNNYEEVTVTHAKTTCNLNVYRRVLTKDGIEMKPNYDVEIDKDVNVLNFYKKDGKLKGKIVHYPCHANLSKDNDLHPDYPGYALEKLEENCETAIFLQGCTGDIRPNCVKDGEFIPGSPEFVIEFASKFVDAINSAISERKLKGNINVDYKTAKLPVDQKYSIEELKTTTFEDNLKSDWKNLVLKKGFPNYETLRIAKLCIDDVNLLFLNGEISQTYALNAKAVNKNTICSGYSNGNIGYLMTAEQIKNGGYEPCGSALYMGIAGTYSQEIENVINKTIEEILK